MLKAFYNNKGSIFGIIIILLISFTMLGFGVDFFGFSSNDENYAIKINDQTISDFEYNSTKESYVNSLRERLGDMYTQVSSLINIDKQVREGLISQSLVVQFAKNLGFTSGDKAVSLRIIELFPENTSLNYSLFLKRTGRSPREFEEVLRNSLINESYQNIVSDLIPITRTEIISKVKKDRELYDINYVEIDPKNFKNVKDGTDEELYEYYNRVATDFEEKEKVSYRYVVFKPEDFINVIKPDENEIELYYSENQVQFTEPEKILCLMIDIKKSDGKDKANKVLERLKNGEDFKKLIKEVSEKKDTKEKWYKRGELDVDVESEIFEKNKAGISEIIEGKDFYTIVNVLDYKPHTIKDLNEVRNEITKEIVEGLAPAFAKDKAENLKVLIDEGKEISEKLAWKKVGLVEAGNSPKEFSGLTDKVLQNSMDKASVFEYGENVVLCEILEYKESNILPFDSLGDKKERLKAMYRENKANDEVQGFLSKIILDLNERDLSVVAKDNKLKLETFNDFSKNDSDNEASKGKRDKGIFAKYEIKEAVLALNKKGDYTKPSVKSGDKFYILQISNVKENLDPVSESEILERTNKAKEEQRTVSIQNILNVLEAKADIKYGRYINLN
ncbi:MAG: SurA N-terminal domain-containing protein [Bdellovibrionota bacterium]